MEKIDKLEMSENKKVLNIFEQSYITEAVEYNTNAPVGTELFAYVLDFFNHNPSEYEKVKAILKAVIAKLSQNALSHTTFCDLFATPSNLPDAILKIINISGKQLAEAFYAANFFKGNAMHSDSYYHVLLLLYYVGLQRDDQLFRLYSLTLIYVKLYNGRKTKYFPEGCIPEVASYLVNNMLRSSHTFKRFKTPFHLVVEYWAPTLDQAYAQRIRATPFDQKEGLVKILAQAWARVDQTFMGVQEHYYAAHAQGLKDATMNVTSNDAEMQERSEQQDIVFEKLAEKINRTLLMKKNKIDNQNIQKMSRVIILPVQYFEQVEKYMNDFEDDEEGDGLRALYETILRAFVLADEPSVCNIHISAMVNKIAGIQTNPTITSFKQMVDRICTNIFKDIFNTQTYNQQQKIRKMVTTVILFRMKASICNNSQYDGM